ncbi:hypothetical protein ACLOAV_009647 [Pseudogymnoascus australis]
MATFSRLCVLLAPVLLLIASSEASVLPRVGFLFNNNSDYHEDVRALGKRLFTYNPGSTDPQDASGSNRPTRKELNAYLPAVFNGQEPYYGFPLPTVSTIARDGVSDERAVSQQQQFGKTPFQIISSRMHGCTTIVVTSNRGVWMTHLWESYSNGKDENGEHLTNAGDPAFNQRVLMFLRGQTVTNPLPNGYADYIAPSGPRIDATLFNNGRSDQTEVFIFTPVKQGIAATEINNPDTLKFEERYGVKGEVSKAIADILGRRPTVTKVPYIRLDTNNAAEAAQLGTNARGTVLFQYDPNSNGSGKKAWRLFVEDRFNYKSI